MTTGASKFIAKSKRLVGTTDFADRIIGYLDEKIDLLARQEYPSPSTFGIIHIAPSGLNTYQLYYSANTTGACNDGAGHVMEAAKAEIMSNIMFENATGRDYFVGLSYCSVPSEVRTNPRTGRLEYLGMKDEIGVVAAPSDITDNGDGTYTFELLDHMLTAADDCTGRTVRLWMPDVADAARIGDEVIVDAVMDTAHTFTTTSTLGQTTVSLDTADYQVAILGPITTLNLSALQSGPYVIIARIPGNDRVPSVSAIDLTVQSVAVTPWTTAVTDGLGSNWVPETDDLYDLGTTSLRWRDIFLSGQVNAKTMVLGTSAGEGSQHIYPQTDNVYDLGYYGCGWRDVWISGLAHVNTLRLITTAGNGITSDVVPATNNFYDLGNGGYRWKDAWIAGIAHAGTLALDSTAGKGVASDVVPASNSSYDFGSAAYRWENVYGINADFAALTLGTGTNGGVASDCNPAYDRMYNLGSATYRWETVWADSLNLSTSAGDGATTIVPKTDNSYQLGSASYKWNKVWAVNTDFTLLTLSDAAASGVSSNLYPAATNTYSVGTSARYYANVYSDNVYYKTNMTTFDNLNDLELIEAYEPTGQYETVEKGGETRNVQLANPATIPWPIIGDIGEDGDVFIDAADATCFLLGAIKQMYQLHKKEVGELKAHLEKMLPFDTERVDA